jgi:hypothetical protein
VSEAGCTLAVSMLDLAAAPAKPTLRALAPR